MTKMKQTITTIKQMKGSLRDLVDSYELFIVLLYQLKINKKKYERAVPNFMTLSDRLLGQNK